ncbi:unnamed protein product, partial [Choristocarpus tenellus]
LPRYSEESGDRLGMERFYYNFCSPPSPQNLRNYPVVCINNHKMWDNKEAVVRALGLPPEQAANV